MGKRAIIIFTLQAHNERVDVYTGQSVGSSQLSIDKMIITILNTITIVLETSRDICTYVCIGWRTSVGSSMRHQVAAPLALQIFHQHEVIMTDLCDLSCTMGTMFTLFSISSTFGFGICQKRLVGSPHEFMVYLYSAAPFKALQCN